MSELLPCPFCGGEAHTIEPARYGKSWGVRCKCGAFLGFEYTEAEAIEAWNTRAAYEMEGWFYLPKPKEGIVGYGEPEMTKTENGYKVRQMVDVVNEAARKWGDDLGEYIMRRICEVWNSRVERTCKNDDTDNDEFFQCSECGKSSVTEFLRGGYGVPRYCPSCGARVVDE